MPADASTSDTCDAALAIVVADGAQAMRLATEALAGAGVAQQAAAHAVLAMVEAREGTPAGAVRHLGAARAALQQAQGLGLQATHAGWLADHAQSLLARREGRLDEASRLLRELHAHAHERPPAHACLSAGALGIVLSMQGDNDAALDLFHQALALARRSADDCLLVNALNNLGSTLSDLYNLEDARPMLEECLAGALRLGQRRQVIFAAGNLVQCLCMMGEAARALEIARAHLQPRERADDPPALQRHEEIAQALLDNDLVDEAEARLGGPAAPDPMSNELATNRVWLMARVHLARGRARDALALALARRRHLDTEGASGTLAADRVHLLRVASQAAQAVGEHALAWELLDEAFRTHDLLLGRAARARRLSLQITYRLQQAEWELDAARQVAQRLEALNAALRVQVAENERLQERLRAQALEDPLTGLPNRRGLLDAGAALLAMGARRSEPLATAMIDLDHFKRVNDTHGHEAGDRVLRAFAELARGATRRGDAVCRYGGEEFVILLCGADAAQASTRMLSLQQQFGTLRFDGAEGSSFACSFSAGVAAWRGEGEALTALLARADQALYTAKAAGRARVVCADD